MAMSLSIEHSSRAFTFRRFVLGSAVALVVAGIGLGGIVYYRNNTPHQLAVRAQLAMEQHDPNRAIDFLSRALAKNPIGANGEGIRNLMAKALIDTGREADARTYVEQVLTTDPTNVDALHYRTESYVHPAFRKFQQAFKPLSADAAKDILATIANGLDALGKQQQDDKTGAADIARNRVGQAELYHLNYLIRKEQRKLAQASLESAQIAQDGAAAAAAQRQLQSASELPEASEQKALSLLHEAESQDEKNEDAPRLIAQYQYEDKNYQAALEVYKRMQARKAVSQPLALTAANALIGNEKTEPDNLKRFAAAEQVLEAYLKDHPKDARIMVAIGQVMLAQNKVDDAVKIAGDVPGDDLDAQLLLANCYLAQKNSAEAVKAAQSMANSHSGVPQVWYMLGQAQSQAGQSAAAADAFHKALALNPNYLDAKRALLRLSPNDNTAAGLASQILRDDRNDMQAWGVTARNLQKVGQEDRARSLLLGLAKDASLPVESKRELIRLLVEFHAADAAATVLDSLPANDPERLALSSDIALGTGNRASARELLAKAVAANPQAVDLRLRYVDLLLNSNLLKDAQVQLDAIRDAKAPLTAQEFLRLGQGYLRIRRPDQTAALIAALPADEKEANGEPKSAEVRVLAQQATAMKSGKAPQEPAVADTASEQKSTADLARAAATAIQHKDYQQALGSTRTGLLQDKSDVKLHELQAQAYVALGKPDDAMADIVAAASVDPNAIEPFSTFVNLFPRDKAATGLGYAGRLLSINRGLGSWAMGQLAEKSEQPALALKYYNDGLGSVNDLTDPRSAKEALYTAVLVLQGSRNDAAAIQKTADQFAQDRQYAISIRCLASNELMKIGDRDGAAAQLKALDGILADANKRGSGNAGAAEAAAMTLQAAQAWLNYGQPGQALAVVNKAVSVGNSDAQLLRAYVRLLQPKDPHAALAVVEKMAAADPQNPENEVALAQAQAADGDCAGAMQTLAKTESLGATGKQLATTARLRLLITMGLLKDASDELASHEKQTADDFSLQLAIGQGWAQLHKPEQARTALHSIPSYAAEYPAAQIALASMDIEAGKADAAVNALQDVYGRSPAAAAQVTGPLFQAYIRAGKADAALELMLQQRQANSPNSAPWRNATLYAAAAAREGKQYDKAAQLIESLDATAQKQAAMDLAMLQLLGNHPAEAAATAAGGGGANDHAPAYMADTLRLLAGVTEHVDASKMLANGTASAVYAALSSMTPEQQTAALPTIAKNLNVLAGDVQTTITELAKTPDPKKAIQQLALSQRLLESGWSTSALDILDGLDKNGTPLTLSLVQRHQALADLHRGADAGKVEAALAARFPDNAGAPPSARIVLASSALQHEQFAQALKILEPLEALNRPEILTSLASIHEKLGQLDAAIALHRRVLKIDPKNVTAANNLAYTLVKAKPGDSAALAEAQKAIQFAIKAAPQVTAFQDTLGWIEILSGKAEDGTRRIARAIPSLRLDPAVHYHLGVGYSRIGQPELARMHLRDVKTLAQDRAAVPELALADSALAQLATKAQ